MFVVIAFFIFSAALLTAGYYAWSVPQQQASNALAARLRELRAHMRQGPRGAPELLRREERGALAYFGDFVAWLGILRRLQEHIQQADLKYRAADVFALALGLGLGSFVLAGVLGLHLFVPRILIALAIGWIPVLYIARVRARRLKKFEENLPDAIDLFTRSMRAGHNIHSGLETLASETVEPVRGEFRKLTEELALGSPIEPALHNLGMRVPLLDVKFFVTGLILQRQTGANMVSVLENLAGLIRERLTMAAKLKAHTAQQRLSAALLCLLPVFVALGFWVLKPEYIRLLYTDPLGSKLLTYAIISEIVGILVIRRMSNIRV
jgi:tight adherence protein B